METPVSIGVILIDSSPTDDFTLNTAASRESFQLTSKQEEALDSPRVTTSESKMDYFRQHIRAIILCSLISLGGIILGWDIGTVGGISIMPSFNNSFGKLYNSDTKLFYLTPTQKGWFIASFSIGCATGVLTFSKISNICGRKIGMMLSLLAYVACITIQLFSGDNFILLLFARVCMGGTVGVLGVLIPMFVSESSPVKIRGSLVVMYQLAITLGILLGNIINFICNRMLSVKDPWNNMTWKITLIFGYLWAIIVSIGVCLTPESVQYLAKIMKDYDRAKISYAYMNNTSVFDYETIDYVNALLVKEDVYTENDPNRGRFEFLFGKPRLGRRLFIGIMVLAFQQLSGINYFFYYSTTLFKDLGIKDTYATSIILSSVNFSSTFVGIYLVESLGRRTTLIYGSFSMFVCMIFYSAFGSLNLRTELSSIVMIIVTCLFISIFAITLGPVSFVLVAELFPTRIRGTSMSICSAISWLVNFAIAFVTPPLISKIGFLLGFIFAGCLLLATIFEVIMVPETKNKTEEDIDLMFLNNAKN